MSIDFIEKLNSEISEKFPLLTPISSLKENGEFNRFDSTKKDDKAIWVCVHLWDFKGKTYRKAFYGNWRHGIQYECKSYGDQETKSKKFKDEEKKKVEEIKDKLEKEKQEKHQACRNKWTPIYFGLPESSPTHEYLKSKKINSNFYARVTPQNVLLVPAWNSKQELVGAQRIYFNQATNRYEKRFTYGIEKLGSFCPFGDIRNAEFIYIAEGFATAASIYMAFKNKEKFAVACVWDTSNLYRGALSIRSINPESKIIFAADNDISDNPKQNGIGERKAKEASDKLPYSIVKTVYFSDRRKDLSDFNDLHCDSTLTDVMKQLHVDGTEFIDFIAMGFSGNNCYFFSTLRKEILELHPNSFKPSLFLFHAPATYWGSKYGYIKNKDGVDTKKPDWDKVVEHLGKDTALAGTFNPEKIRGLGVWEDNQKIVVNTGESLYVENAIRPIVTRNSDLKYFYEPNEPQKLTFNELPSDSDLKICIDAFSSLEFKRVSDNKLLLGWVFSAQTFPTQKWRSHLWITGPRGSGKSTVLKFIQNSIHFSKLIQGSTAAGIRQGINNNALAIIYDESEPDSKSGRSKMSEVIELARFSSRSADFEILRGTSHGKAKSFNTQTCFCMGSIQLSTLRAADSSRFTVLELVEPRPDTMSKFVQLEKKMERVRRISKKLLFLGIHRYERHKENINMVIKILRSKNFEPRKADQLAPMIAGYFAILSDSIISEKFIDQHFSCLSEEAQEEQTDLPNNDSISCLEHLLELPTRHEGLSVSQIIERMKKEETCDKTLNEVLGIFGIRYSTKSRELIIHATNSQLKRALAEFGYSDLSRLMSRHPKVISFDDKKTKTARINGKERNCYFFKEGDL